MGGLEKLEYLRTATDYLGLLSMQLTLPRLSEAMEDNFLLYFAVSIEILITNVMWFCILVKMCVELSENNSILLKRIFFYEYFGLSFVATYLFTLTTLIALAWKQLDIVGILLVWQIIHASADLELSEQMMYRKRHTFPGFCLCIILCPILARREITDRLTGQEFCVETLESLVGFHKRTCLGVLLSAAALALLNKDMANDILFPAEYTQNRIRNLVDLALVFPIIPYWMVIGASVACSVNLWYPMMMQQLMFDAGSLLIDEIYQWYIDKYGGQNEEIY